MSEPTVEALNFTAANMVDWEFLEGAEADTIKHVARMLDEYASAAVEAEREACAKACEEIRKEIVCPEECAAAIRARGESEPTQQKENET
jgi:hypothetical protein